MAYHDYSYYQAKYNNLTFDPTQGVQTPTYYDITKDQNFSNAVANSAQVSNPLEIPSQRTLLGRTFDALSAPMYASAGFADALVNGKNPFQQATQGFAAGNPFGPGDPAHQYTYSQVLNDAGWQPTTLYGKIARGILGFGLDVALDPTTYLSGGASAVLKGTGRLGKSAEALANLGKDATTVRALGNDAAKTAYADAIKSGADVTVAQKAAKNAYKATIGNPPAVTEMTPSIAEQIVKERAGVRGINMSPEQLAQDAQNLTNQYNKVIGLRNNPTDLTWSLGNIPFADKIWGWTGLTDKTFTLAKGTDLQQLGDALGTSRIYSAIRDSIYGSKIGNLLSTTSPLYNYAHNSPKEFFSILKHIDYVKQNNLDKVTEERLIREKASEYGMNPAQAKEAIDLVQNKTVWSKVMDSVQFSNTQEAQRLRSMAEASRSEMQAQLDELQATKSAMDNLQYAHDKNIFSAQHQIEDLQNQIDQHLSNIDSSHLPDVQALQQHVDMLQSELDKKHQQVYTSPSPDTTQHPILDSYNQWQDQLKQVEAYQKMNDMGAKASKNGSEANKAQFKAETTDHAPNQSARFDTIDKLSEFLFGKKGSITYDVHNNDLEKVMKMVQDNVPFEEIKQFVESRPAMMNGRYKAMYQHIAQMIGYGHGFKAQTWQDYYHKPMEKLAPLMGIVGPKQETDLRAYAKLQEDAWKRTKMVSEMSKMSDNQLYQHIANQQRDHQLNFANELDQSWLDKARHEAIDSQSVSNDSSWQYSHATDSSVVNTKITTKELDDITGQLAARMHVAVTPDKVEHIKNVASQMQDVLDHVFHKDWSSLSPKQQHLALNLASDAWAAKVAGKSGLQDTTFFRDQFANQIKAAQKQAHVNRIDAILKDAKVGSDIHYIPNGSNRVSRGTIVSIQHDDNGVLKYEVKPKNSDSTIHIGVAEVSGVLKDKAAQTAENAIRESPVAQQVVQDTSALEAKLKQAKDELINAKALHTAHAVHVAQQQKLIDGYTSRIAKLHQDMQNAEMDKLQFDKAQYGANIKDMEVLSRKIQQHDKILSNADAFETYARTKFSDKRINDILEKNQIDTGRIVLDDKPIPDQVKAMAKELRTAFNQMAEGEIKIGKLTREQVDKNMDSYVSHVLTPEGAKFFSNQKKVQEAEKKGTFLTSDLGYGKKFNPHAQHRQITSVTLPDGRTIESPTIEQINQAFAPLTKGKNIFAENLADIYTARAMKHVELMYDHKYMNNMMNDFGRPLVSSTPMKGYKSVINYGMMRQSLHELASTQLGLEVSRAQQQFLRDSMDSIRLEAQQRDLPVRDVLNEHIQQFHDTHYPDSVRQEKYKQYFADGLVQSKIPESTLNDLAIPMVELASHQIEGLRNYFNDTMNQTKQNLMDMIESAKRRVGYEYIDDLKRNNPNQFFSLASLDSPEHQAAIDKLISNNPRIIKLRQDLADAKAAKPPQIVQVNDAIVNKANQARKTQIAKDHNRLLQMYDKLLHFIKINQTTVAPAFHMRNSISNSFLNWLGVGQDALNPKTKLLAFRTVLAKGDKHKSPASPWTITQNGQDVHLSWSQLYDLAHQHGAIDTGFFQKDLRVGTADNQSNFSLYKWGSTMGNHVENTDRLIHFASMLRQGHTPQEAADHVKQFLFDYGDLTAFEQNVMKRIMPYYTWMRKNIRLQLSQLIDQPGKYQKVAKVFGEVNGMSDQQNQVDWNTVPSFAQGMLQTPWTVMVNHKTEPLLFNANILPTSNISDIPDPSHPIESLKNLFNQITPIAKVPIEQSLNHSFYLDHPIVQEKKDKNGNVTSSPAGVQRLNNILSNFALYNLSKGLNQTDGTKFGFNLFNDVTGVKLQPLDYQTYRKQYIQQLLDQQNR